ncbi:MAG: membrane protein insertase YidC [Acidobacteriota bacterium]
MEKRTILAIALSLLVLFAFQYINQKYFPPEEPTQIADSTANEPVTAPREKAETVVEKQPEPLFEASESDTKADGPREVLIEGELYKAVLDSKGAVLSSWILNQYKSSQGNDFEMISVGDQGEEWSYPGSMMFEDPNTTELANEEVYEVTVDGRPYMGMPLSAPKDVVMTLRRGSIAIQKTYSFKEENYTVGLSASFVNEGQALEGMFLLAQDIGPIEEHLEGRYAALKAVYFDGDKVRRKSAPGEEDGNVEISGNIRWAGLDMHYFSAIAIPEKLIPSFDIRGYEIKSETMQGKEIERSLLSLKIPVDGSLNYLMYLGPKTQANLKAVPQFDLSGVIDYGMFKIIALPLLSALHWIYQYVDNYGLAIILLTLFISILLFPLRLKQILSMRKMQVVQPKVKAIQEKYKKYKKTDPKRADMNREVMALYKEHNVNPMGGCLPLLVQFPLLIAFYRLIANSIELRQAPFILWIQDLSAKDPSYILPIVMGITMFLSQKMTPMAPTTDNSQAKMMKYMPIGLTILFLFYSSGLNLYFLCSNIFQVAFQKIAERWMGDGRNVKKSKRK